TRRNGFSPQACASPNALSGGGFRGAETNAEPSVLLALFLDFGDVNRSDLLGLRDMCAAAGLTVNARILADAHQADSPHADRRANILRLDDGGIGSEFFVG